MLDSEKEFERWWKRDLTQSNLSTIPPDHRHIVKQMVKAAYTSAYRQEALHWKNNHDDVVRKKENISKLYRDLLRDIEAKA